MESKETSKRLASPPKKGKPKRSIIPLVATGGIAGVLVASYLALCAATGGDQLWPHSYIYGVDVSGLTESEAAEKLASEIPARFAEKKIELYEPSSDFRVSLDTSNLVRLNDPAAVVNAAQLSGNYHSFLERGSRYVVNLLTDGGPPVNSEDEQPTLVFTDAGKEQLESALKQIAEALGITGNETTYEVTGDKLVLTKGVTSQTVDIAAARQGVEMAMAGTGPETIEVKVTKAPPPEPDFEAIHADVFREPADAYLDRASGKVMEGSVGIDFDIETARAALAAVGDGESCEVPLKLTAASLSAADLKQNLFREVLGSASTKFSGTADRKKNIQLAAGFINNYIVLPGETFSYNRLCGPYSPSKGYGKAGAYVGGATVDTTAGGICQLSSTLYWAILKANLEVTERHCHGYEPSYIAGGLDATVYGDSLDLKFRNNTKYPVKVEAYVDGNNYVSVNLYGTNTSGIHGEPYSANRTITQYAQTVYEANSSVPRGTTRRDSTRTAYNAVRVEAYQKLVDANGNVISTTLLHQDNYKKRDAVILYNPNDAGLWGVKTSKSSTAAVETAEPTPEPTVEATPTQAPVQTAAPTPVPTPPPVQTQAPQPTPEPASAPTPEPVPVETQAPEPPAPTPEPVVTQAPEPTPEPVPVETQAPEPPAPTPVPVVETPPPEPVVTQAPAPVEANMEAAETTDTVPPPT